MYIDPFCRDDFIYLFGRRKKKVGGGHAVRDWLNAWEINKMRKRRNNEKRWAGYKLTGLGGMILLSCLFVESVFYVCLFVLLIVRFFLFFPRVVEVDGERKKNPNGLKIGFSFTRVVME